MVEERGEPFLLPLPCDLPYAVQRLWRVLCWLTFPSASALGSTDSAAGCPALFVGFPATIAESDLPRPFIIGYGSSPSRCGPERRTAAGQTWDLPVPIQGASAHARFFDHAGPFGPCDGASETCCLRGTFLVSRFGGGVLSV